tara:strand:- start:153 stop:650 length:498 start_codon:yes stop_codon:yes gene_type:complete
MGAGILPVAKIKNKLYFLFAVEVSDNKWSDFGGKSEKNETTYNTAIREGYEETNGFFGSKSNLKLIVDNNFLYKIQKNNNSYTSYLFHIFYDKNLPFFFNNNSKFMNDNFKHLINKNGFFEKKMVSWFSIEEIKNKKHIFRHFYREIVDLILDNEENIKNRIVKI